MIPYLGCKESFAGELLQNIPEVENFYDLFGGGGSVTEAAFRMKEDGLFGKWEKWQNIHYNEINKGVCLLNKAIWSGKFDFEHAKQQIPSKERYYSERRQNSPWGAFVSNVWSFGNKDDCFIYSENKKNTGRLEHLERIARMEKSPLIPDVKVTCGDYREVEIKPRSVAYCDIPYETGKKHYGIKFDYNAFYEWAASSKFPVYFSSYDLPLKHEGSFELVFQKDSVINLNIFEKPTNRVEKLFWNGVKA